MKTGNLSKIWKYFSRGGPDWLGSSVCASRKDTFLKVSRFSSVLLWKRRGTVTFRCPFMVGIEVLPATRPGQGLPAGRPPFWTPGWRGLNLITDRAGRKSGYCLLRVVKLETGKWSWRRKIMAAETDPFGYASQNWYGWKKMPISIRITVSKTGRKNFKCEIGWK